MTEESNEASAAKEPCEACGGTGVVRTTKGAIAFSGPCATCTKAGKVQVTPDIFEHMQDLFSEFFKDGKPSTNDIYMRVTISAREGRRGTTRSIEVTRRVRCETCKKTPYRGAEPGCEACNGGVVTREETLRVQIPKEIVTTNKLRLAGKGHEARDGDAGDLYVFVHVEPPWWKSLNEKPGAAAAIVLVALGLIALAVTAMLASRRTLRDLPDLGHSCQRDTDCQSLRCLSLYESRDIDLGAGLGLQSDSNTKLHLPPVRTGGVCTIECESAADCPSHMACTPIETHLSYQGAPAFPPIGTAHPNALACAPLDRAHGTLSP